MQTRLLVDGLTFPEAPRWREGRLWFSDMYGGRVCSVSPHGELETVVEVPQRPGGLGWLPDGRLLVVSMVDRRLLRLEGGALVEHARLGELAGWHCNDLLVDGAGGAYVGHFGFDIENAADYAPAELLRVEPDGRARVVAEELAFPNGMALTPDGRTLIVAESLGPRLTAFEIRADGSLGGRRPWARLEGVFPDGICLDREGAVWFACPRTACLYRVREGGELLDRVPVTAEAYACALGGAGGRTLYACLADTAGAEEAGGVRGRIEVLEVPVPAA